MSIRKMKFELVKPIFEYPIGYIIEVDEHGWGSLGSNEWGWPIPFFILENNPDWFKRVDI